MPTVRVKFGQVTFTLATFVHIRNISAIIDLILTKQFLGVISLGQTQPGQLLKAGLEITKPALRDQEGPKAPSDRGYLSCIIPPYWNTIKESAARIFRNKQKY